MEFDVSLFPKQIGCQHLSTSNLKSFFKHSPIYHMFVFDVFHLLILIISMSLSLAHVSVTHVDVKTHQHYSSIIGHATVRRAPL